MAVRQPDSICLICDPDPCKCFAKPPKAKAAKRAPKIEVPKEVPPPVPVQRKPSALEAMRAAASAAKLEARAEEPAPAKSRFDLSEDDALMLQAIRNLKDAFGEVQLIGGDAEKYRPYLDRPATTGERITAWKARTRR